MERFTVLCPYNLMGRLELADRCLQEMEYVDLLATLSGATVSAGPGERGELSARGVEEQLCVSYTFSLPPNYGDRPTLFLHTGTWVAYAVALA